MAIVTNNTSEQLNWKLYKNQNTVIKSGDIPANSDTNLPSITGLNFLMIFSEKEAYSYLIGSLFDCTYLTAINNKIYGPSPPENIIKKIRNINEGQEQRCLLPPRDPGSATVTLGKGLGDDMLASDINKTHLDLLDESSPVVKFYMFQNGSQKPKVKNFANSIGYLFVPSS